MIRAGQMDDLDRWADALESNVRNGVTRGFSVEGISELAHTIREVLEQIDALPDVTPTREDHPDENEDQP
jgi:hypothetical protein